MRNKFSYLLVVLINSYRLVHFYFPIEFAHLEVGMTSTIDCGINFVLKLGYLFLQLCEFLCYKVHVAVRDHSNVGYNQNHGKITKKPSSTPSGSTSGKGGAPFCWVKERMHKRVHETTPKRLLTRGQWKLIRPL